MRHILFGDSIGFGVGDYQYGGWATRLRLCIDQEKKSKDHNLVNLSISGDTSRGLLNRMEKEAKLRIRDKDPDSFKLIIAIGANDSKINKDDLENDISPKEFEKNIHKLIGIAKQLSCEVILIGLVPVHEPLTTPYKENKHYQVGQIEKYNQILNTSAQKNNIMFVDMFEDWMQRDLSQLFSDGLHPNTLGHEIMYKTIRREIFH